MKRIHYKDRNRVISLSCAFGKFEKIRIMEVPPEVLKKAEEGEYSMKNEFVNILFSVSRGKQDDLAVEACFTKSLSACLAIKQARIVFPVVFPELILTLHPACEKKEVPHIHSLLAVDLGNTRTGAVICRDTQASQLEWECLQLWGHANPEKKSVPQKSRDGAGIFMSNCGLGASFTFAEASPSFVRLGSEVAAGGKYRRAFSSPKRYFWDQDKTHPDLIREEKWSYTDWKDKNDYNTSFIGEVTSELAASLENTDDPSLISRSTILAGAIYELLEQAERFLNPPGNAAVPLHLIRDLAVAFPAAWTDSEHDLYESVVRKGMEHFVSQRCMNLPIRLHMECHEASAALMTYICGEFKKYNGDMSLWLQSFGRPNAEDPSQSSLRIGLIDIGGGTSDLVIADATFDLAVEQLKVNPIYCDGTREAGDLLISKIIERFIFPQFMSTLISADAPEVQRKKCMKEIVEISHEMFSSLKDSASNFWFDLGLEFLKTMNRSAFRKIEIKDQPVIYNEMKKLHKYLCDSKKIRMELLESFDVIDQRKDLTFSLPADSKDQFREILEDTFSKTPSLFGSAITAFDCDLVLISGKPTECQPVCEFFNDYIPLPPDAFISLSNYEVQQGFPMEKNGKIADSKSVTTVGCGLFAISKINPPAIGGVRMSGEDSTYLKNDFFWGECSLGNTFRNNRVILAPRDADRPTDGIFQFWGASIVFLRKKYDVNFAYYSPGYEFRVKPGHRIELDDGSLLIKLVREENNLLSFRLIRGTCRIDGKKFDVGEEPRTAEPFFELRIRTEGDQRCWLDSGLVFEYNKFESNQPSPESNSTENKS